MTSSTFANWFKLQLGRRDMTMAELSRRTGIPFSTVQAWGSGRSVPAPANCDLIADAFSMDLDLVLWQAGHRPNLDVIDPDDPATTIISLAKRVDWSKPERFNWVEGFMRQWIDLDHGENFKRKKERE